jgi:MYXO-CTERM domain-containing protein
VTQSTTATESAPIWPWLVAGLVALIAVAGFLVMRRRREDEEVYYEEPYVEEAVEAAPIRSEPAPFAPDPEPQFLRTAPLVAAPLAAAVVSDEPAPVAAEEASLAKPEAEEVASLTDADAPVADRPWLEMSLRPVRAGTNVDEALVEIELTVGNSGSVAAQDVRISTFMFASGPAGDGDVERMLIERGDDGVPPVTIRPGEGTRVDATLALSKADLIESTNGSILPIIVADARYTLPDGSEGRTSASFTIGVSEEGGPAMAPIQLNERAMHDDVEARLHGVPEHA